MSPSLYLLENYTRDEQVGQQVTACPHHFEFHSKSDYNQWRDVWDPLENILEIAQKRGERNLQ